MQSFSGDNLDDGWDDFDVDEDAGIVAKEEPEVVDGWGSEDDFFNDDDDDGNYVSPTDEAKNPTVVPRSSSAPAQTAPAPPVGDASGWEEDDDLNFDVEDDDPPIPDSKVPVPPSQTPSKTLEKLENYVMLLPDLKTSVNAVLETEYNNSQKAMEILEYFTERPGLVDYTIEKELPRMDYVVIEENGMPLQDKDQIAAWMLQAGSAGSMLPRCANQSLLADLLQAMTGPDMLIRPQFLATAIATSCNFVLDALQESVMVKASLELTIPTEAGRWKIADLAVFCQLQVASSPPSILYRLEVVKPTQQSDDWKAQMASAAQLIESMELSEESFLNVSYQQGEDGLHFRDAFLQQSQTLLQNSAVGFRSALKEIDAVAGISTKLSKFQGFLPEDVMEAADRVQEQPAVHAANPEQRPTSILGGFLTSGLNRLAQTVSIPEEDAEYYKEWQTQQQQQQQHMARGHGSTETRPQLYNRPQDNPHSFPRGPQLYNQTKEQGPQLYNDQQPSALRHYNRTEAELTAPVDRGQPKAPPFGTVAAHVGQTSSPPLPQTNQYFNERPQNFEVSRPRTQVSETNPSGNEDGWEMDDDDLFSPDELAAMETKSPWEEQQSNHRNEAPGSSDQDDLLVGWVYDPETDIIPTRKRWINPRPGMRTKEFFMAGQ